MAIHGLQGHRITTWTDKASGKFWLKDPAFLPSTAPNARIFTFGYDTQLLSGITNNSMEGTAMTLLRQLHHERAEESRKVPILFICHSLGGLVLKQMINRAGQSPSLYDSIRHKISGLVFLATPHRGSTHADMLATITRLSDLLPAAGSTKSYWVQDLRQHSRTVEGLHDSFNYWLQEVAHRRQVMPIRSFWETDRIPKYKLFVRTADCASSLVTIS